MVQADECHPKLRPVEAFRENGGEPNLIGLRDATGLSPVALSMSPAAVQILSLMDGRLSCNEICGRFEALVGQPLSRKTLDKIVSHLEEAMLLEGPSFEVYYQGLLDAYRSQPARSSGSGSALACLDEDRTIFAEMLADAGVVSSRAKIVGLVAPHLDYARGWPCYAKAYATLVNRPAPQRVVILGTNHFGRSSSVVATGIDFQTPLGCTRTDRCFLDRLESRLGSLREYELDHAREHSIELQLAWLQYLYDAQAFEIVAFLCPDPCGPTGTAPHDGQGVDLKDFAEALGECVADDAKDTLVVAGADLSHIGTTFGDPQPVDESFLENVERRDRAALEKYVTGDRPGFLACLTEDQNPTRVCSAGCLFALSTALPNASAELLGYHQAVDLTRETCVTCAAIAMT